MDKKEFHYENLSSKSVLFTPIASKVQLKS